MKKKYVIFGIIFLFITGIFILDNQLLYKRRFLRHDLWENYGGERVRGDFIQSSDVISFKKDIIVFEYRDGKKDTLLYRGYSWGEIKLEDPSTHAIGIYKMKGASWVNYLFWPW